MEYSAQVRRGGAADRQKEKIDWLVMGKTDQVCFCEPNNK